MASKLCDIWTTFIERPLDKVGLFRNPLKRFVVVEVGALILLRTLKPDSLFDNKTGEARPSILWSESVHAVPFDYITLSTFIAGLSVMLV